MRVQVRTLLAGLLVAASVAGLALTGGAIGIGEPWPVLLVVGAGLLVGVPRLRHALALVSGISIGAATAWASAVVLPDAPVGRAIAASVAVLLVTVMTLASRGKLRFGLQLVGWAAMTALVDMSSSAITTSPRPADLVRVAVVLLLASGVGLLIAQVAQLVGIGIVRGHRDVAPAILVLALVLTPLLVASTPAAADDTDARTDRRVIEHRQTVVSTHAPDGTVTGGRVVTRLSVGGNGADEDVTVVLRDQAVRDLRSLSTLVGPAAPVVSGTTVTHAFAAARASGADGASGASGAEVRTVATLGRTVPIDVDVAITLDGEPVTPAAVLGRSGRLEVTYTLTNRTVEPRELRHFDGSGRPRTVTRDVAVPFVGDLVVLLDDRFTAVRSDDAAVTALAPRTGGGSAVTELRAGIVLAEPFGGPVRTVTWRADVEDAVVPPVSIRLAAVRMQDMTLGAASDDRAELTARVLRDVADASGLVQTGLRALEAAGADEVLSRTSAALETALAVAVAAGADINELRALVAAQDRRVDDGDGLVHGLLDAADVSATGAMSVHASAVHVLELAGLDADDAPGALVRLALALLLLVAVGLLGRAIATLTGTTTT